MSTCNLDVPLKIVVSGYFNSFWLIVNFLESDISCNDVFNGGQYLISDGVC